MALLLGPRTTPSGGHIELIAQHAPGIVPAGPASSTPLAAVGVGPLRGTGTAWPLVPSFSQLLASKSIGLNPRAMHAGAGDWRRPLNWTLRR